MSEQRTMKCKQIKMIGGGGRKQILVKDIMPTVMASWYAKSTFTSRPTPYVIEYEKKTDDVHRSR